MAQPKRKRASRKRQSRRHARLLSESFAGILALVAEHHNTRRSGSNDVLLNEALARIDRALEEKIKTFVGLVLRGPSPWRPLPRNPEAALQPLPRLKAVRKSLRLELREADPGFPNVVTPEEITNAARTVAWNLWRLNLDSARDRAWGTVRDYLRQLCTPLPAQVKEALSGQNEDLEIRFELRNPELSVPEQRNSLGRLQLRVAHLPLDVEACRRWIAAFALSRTEIADTPALFERWIAERHGWLEVGEAARYLDFNKPRVTRMCDSGALTAIGHGAARRVCPASVLKALRAKDPGMFPRFRDEVTEDDETETDDEVERQFEAPDRGR